MATPTQNSTPVTYDLPSSNSNEIDSLVGGTIWGSSLGAGVTLSYSFPQGNASYDSDYGTNGDAAEWTAGWYALTAVQQQAFKSALSTLSAVANITFVELNDNTSSVGEIRVAISQQVDNDDSGAWAYLPSDNPNAGDIWLSPESFLSDPISASSWEFNTLIHELGHAIGLSHPFSSSSSSGASLPQGPEGTDNIFYSVMSYTDDPSGNDYVIDRYPDTPMLLDIQALQYLYGKNNSHNSDDTNYAFTNTGKYFETLWDGSGQDTIDYTGSSIGATIDLREGQWSSLGQPIVFLNDDGVEQYTDARTVWIAYGTEIEDAKGSQENDLIYGNDLNNALYGHSGVDTLSGFAGNDVLDGGSGDDHLDGGSGIDMARFAENRDTYQITLSDSGASVAHSDEGNDSLLNIERMAFADTNLAVDISGNAGITAKILGSVFGENSITNKEYVGIGLQLLDEGMEYEALMEYALSEAGATSNQAVVELLYTNLVKAAPSAGESAHYVSLLENGMTKGALGIFAADHELNTNNIDLIGLAQTGIEFI